MTKRSIGMTILFGVLSAALTAHATGSLSAGGAVLFGLWYLGGILEMMTTIIKR